MRSFAPDESMRVYGRVFAVAFRQWSLATDGA